MILENLQIAIPTAFDENEDLNIEKTLSFASHLVKNDIKSLLVCGTTGEQHSMSLSEKIELLEAFDSFQKSNPQAQIMIGLSSTRQLEAIELSKKISTSSLFGSVLGFPPYIIPTQNEAMFYAKSIIENLKKPVVLYNNPRRTGFSLEVQNIAKLSNYSNVYGLKEASNPSCVPELKKLIEKPFLYFAGGDVNLWENLQMGYNAVSSIAGNLYPVELKNILNEYFSGNKEVSKEPWKNFWTKISLLYKGSTISNLKFELKKQGLDVGIPRSPLGKNYE